MNILPSGFPDRRYREGSEHQMEAVHKFATSLKLFFGGWRLFRFNLYICTSFFRPIEEKEVLSPLERWVRGLNQQFAKLSYALKRTGGSNPPLSAVF